METLLYGFGITDTKSRYNTEPQFKSYRVWRDMIRRCYSQKAQIRNPTYIGCSVCDEWKHYSNFKKWFDLNYVDGYQLDKDILINGNKVYSPETCCFIPPYLNSLFNDSRKIRGLYPQGVCFDKYSHKFNASIKNNGKRIHLGVFSCPNEGHKVWLKSKHEYARELAIKAYMNNEIDERIMNAIIKKAYELH